LRSRDNNRLSKAFLLSLGIHLIIFAGLNIFNWFPESITQNLYSPLTVKIDSRYVESTEPPPSTTPVDLPENPSNQSEPVAESISPSPKIEPDIDPYADLGVENISPVFPDESVPREKGIVESSYIPSGKDIIELEDLVDEDRTSSNHLNELRDEPSEKSETSILSDKEIEGLQNSFNKDGDQSSFESANFSESNSSKFEYNDQPVKFDSPGEQRELLTNPPPEMPDNLSVDFPPEITYIVSFSLKPDGYISELTITPSSVYPNVDASIRKALRSWIFEKSSGNDEVTGTITLIFKGK
jgi:hypothetical protein